MPDNENKEIVPISKNTEILRQESQKILDQIIPENNPEKVQDLTALFNLNQTKKNIARNNKLNDVLDSAIEQAHYRLEKHPEELSNQELFQAVKTVQDAIEKNQKQINGQLDGPIIQINQQNNELNLGQEGSLDKFDRASKERIRMAIMGLMNNINESNNSGVDEDDK